MSAGLGEVNYPFWALAPWAVTWSDLYLPGEVEVKFRSDEEMKHLTQYLAHSRSSAKSITFVIIKNVISVVTNSFWLQDFLFEGDLFTKFFSSHPFPSHPLHSSSVFFFLPSLPPFFLYFVLHIWSAVNSLRTGMQFVNLCTSTPARHNNMDKLHRCTVEWKKPDTRSTHFFLSSRTDKTYLWR